MSLLNLNIAALAQIADRGKKRTPCIVCQVWYRTLTLTNPPVENIVVLFLCCHARNFYDKIE